MLNMAIELNRAYQKLILVMIVMGAATVAYIYGVDIYIRYSKVSLKNGFLNFVSPNSVLYIENADKSAGGKYEGSSNSHNDMMVPGKNAWIPYPVRRNRSGPFIIKKNNGELIKYTNYSFFPLTFYSRVLLNNPNICKDTENLTFLIMVHTAVPHFNRRKQLRETWANPKLLKHHQSRLLFLLGVTNSSTIQKDLEIESEIFKDIVQGDFIDDYHNLTHKGILGFRWITQYCENAKFILKIDDDVFVNIFLVIHELLPKYQVGQRIIACRLLTNETIARKGKHAVDPDYFPGYQRSPIQYCAGPFVLIFRHLIPELFQAAKTTPFYWVDDLYLFGILPNQIGNVYFQFVGNADNIEENALQCFKGENPCKYLAAYAWTQGTMYTYWQSTLTMYEDLVQEYAIDIR